MPITLDEMAKLARSLLDAEADVDKAEKALKEANERLRVLREETIPGVMTELGLESVNLSDGTVVKVKDEVYASIPAAKREEAFTWLVDHDHAALIKTEVSIEWGKGELNKAVTFFKRIVKKNPNAQLNQSVHPQTLKAFVREQLEDGVDIPMDVFGARSVSTAIVIPKKGK